MTEYKEELYDKENKPSEDNIKMKKKWKMNIYDMKSYMKSWRKVLQN